MEHTGTRDGHDLVLWWPEAEGGPRGFRIKKEWFAGRNPWLPVIKASEYCAVFGLVSSRCLQHHGLKTCKNLEMVPFTPLKDIVLDTSVFIVDPTPVQAGVSFVLGQLLVMWKERDVLRVAKLSGPQDNVVQLEYRGRMPRLALKMLTTKYEVSEPQAIRDVSQKVWIFQERCIGEDFALIKLLKYARVFLHYRGETRAWVVLDGLRDARQKWAVDRLLAAPVWRAEEDDAKGDIANGPISRV